jgi:hypothetical protein
LKDIAELHKLKDRLEVEVSQLEDHKSRSTSFEDYEDRYYRAVKQAEHWKDVSHKLAFKFTKVLRGFYLDMIEIKQDVIDFKELASRSPC